LVLISLTMLGTLLLAASLAPPATAEHSCQHILAILDGEETGIGELTSDELLACGLSPEAIDPCEGQPSGPSLDECRARTGTSVEDFPSINAPAGASATSTASASEPEIARGTGPGQSGIPPE
jgi:hypothetical protein